MEYSPLWLSSTFPRHHLSAGRLNEELDQLGFVSSHLDLCDANDFPTLFRDHNRG